MDEQSNSSFIDPSVIEKFNLSCPETIYATTTLDGVKSNIRGFIVSDLEIKGVGKYDWIKLPDLFTNEHIPDTRSEIATKEIVEKHYHIATHSKHFPEIIDPDCNVLLLIGSNCGPAMKTYHQYGDCLLYTSDAADE